MDIASIDRNFTVESTVTEPDLVWKNVLSPEFALYGLLLPDEQAPYYHRLPTKLGPDVIEHITGWLGGQTAGGRVRFRTDARYVAIHAEMHKIAKMPHFTTIGSSGFDLYASFEGSDGEQFMAAYKPPYNVTDGYEGIAVFRPMMRDFTLNFPLYSGVKEL